MSSPREATVVVLDFFWRFAGGGEWVRDLSLAIAPAEAEAEAIPHFGRAPAVQLVLFSSSINNI
jgi:hypothetical protein